MLSKKIEPISVVAITLAILPLYLAVSLALALLRTAIRAGSTHKRIEARYRQRYPDAPSPSRASLVDYVRSLFSPGFPKPSTIRFVGFFHPYCNAGGGGERVLWCAVNAVHRAYPFAHAVVYTGDIDSSPSEILHTAQERFGTKVDASRVDFVFLPGRRWVEASRYPYFTMLGQTLGSLVLAFQAFFAFIPDTFIDTMGYAFSFPVFALVGHSHVACYVHYPTISTDMLSKVRTRQLGFNNRGFIARSSILTLGKYYYYRLFAMLYGLVGRTARVVLVNSSWTAGHIKSLWGIPDATHIVYPPCDTRTLEAFSLQPRQSWIVSLSQFRPEKNHALQIKAFARFLSLNPNFKSVAKLIMVGGCRNAEDQARVAELLRLRDDAGLSETDVEIRTNVPFPELKELLSKALVGLHTMKDEHFGIGVVEFMAAGNITLASNSAGPKMDIVVPFEGSQTGWLALTEEEYSSKLAEIFKLDVAAQLRVQTVARKSVSNRFSEQFFESEFIRLMRPVLDSSL